jgi:hypothetical protein
MKQTLKRPRWMFPRHGQFTTSLMLAMMIPLPGATFAAAQTKGNDRLAAVEHLIDFQVIEFRRYTIRDGERKHFAQYFESYFPEAFQQLGALAIGEFLERQNQTGFTWLRAFHTMDDRAKANAQFYYGPLWKEHKTTLNNLMVDSDNVLLLRPLHPEKGLTVLPAVDPVTEPEGAQGIIVAQIFAIKPSRQEEFAGQAEAAFAGYRIDEIHEAGTLVTLDEKNNFPQLPVRTDGPYLVWLGVVQDDKQLSSVVRPLLERARKSLVTTGLLRAEPETVILDPTMRSRLRWLPVAK